MFLSVLRVHVPTPPHILLSSGFSAPRNYCTLGPVFSKIVSNGTEKNGADRQVPTDNGQRYRQISSRRGADRRGPDWKGIGRKQIGMKGLGSTQAKSG